MTNRPEQLLDGEVTGRGRIEHQFLTFGAIVVLFIEVKKDLLSGEKRLDQLAQVLAEADGLSPNPCRGTKFSDNVNGELKLATIVTLVTTFGFPSSVSFVMAVTSSSSSTIPVPVASRSRNAL